MKKAILFVVLAVVGVGSYAADAPQPEKPDVKSPLKQKQKPKGLKGKAAGQLWNAVPNAHAAAHENKETQATADLDAYFENRAGGSAVSPDEKFAVSIKKKKKEESK